MGNLSWVSRSVVASVCTLLVQTSPGGMAQVLTAPGSHSLLQFPKNEPSQPGQKNDSDSAEAPHSTPGQGISLLGAAASGSVTTTPPAPSQPTSPASVAPSPPSSHAGPPISFTPRSSFPTSKRRSARSLASRGDIASLLTPPAALAPPSLTPSVAPPASSSPQPLPTIPVAPNPTSPTSSSGSSSIGPTPSSPTPTATATATLSWSPNTEPDLRGYKIYVGTGSGIYNYPGSPFVVGNVAAYTLTSLSAGQTYFFAVSAYDDSGNESALSAEVSKSIF